LYRIPAQFASGAFCDFESEAPVTYLIEQRNFSSSVGSNLLPGESSKAVFSCKFSIKMSWKRDFLTIQGNSGKITDVEGEKYAF